MTRKIPLLLLTLALVLTAGNTHAAATPPVLQIAAASDLRFAFEEIARLHESLAGVHVRTTFGSSGLLMGQIEQGAPFDVFFSADEAFVRTLAGRGHVTAATVQLYAIGRIVLWVRPDSPLDVGLGLAVLRDPRIRFLAVANPVHAPYGRAAVEALRSAGLYTVVQPRLVLGENVSQTLQYVRTGNADAGIVALSLAVAPAMRDTGRHWLIPANLHRPIRQAAAVTTRSSQPRLSGDFIAFVNGPTGRPIMRRFGFAPPGENP